MLGCLPPSRVLRCSFSEAPSRPAWLQSCFHRARGGAGLCACSMWALYGHQPPCVCTQPGADLLRALALGEQILGEVTTFALSIFPVLLRSWHRLLLASAAVWASGQCGCWLCPDLQGHTGAHLSQIPACVPGSWGFFYIKTKTKQVNLV